MEIKNSHGKFFLSQSPEVFYFFTFLKKITRIKRLESASLKILFLPLAFQLFFFPFNNFILEAHHTYTANRSCRNYLNLLRLPLFL